MEDTYVAQTEATFIPPVEKPKKNLPKFAWVTVVLIFLLLVVSSVLFLSIKPKQNSINTPTKNAENSTAKATPAPEISPKVDTTNWKTLKSSDGKFSVKYPQGVSPDASSSAILSIMCIKSECPPNYNIFNFTVKKSDKTSIQQYIASLNTTNPNSNPYVKDYKIIEINGVNAVEVLTVAPTGSNTGPTVSVFIIIDGVGYIYSFTYLDPNLNSVTNLDALPDPNPNILSTLNTGSQTSIVNVTKSWKQYTSTSQGITIQYPSSWFITEYNSDPCINFSNSSEPSPEHSQTVISLCTYPDQTLSQSDNPDDQVTVNGRTGIRVEQVSNWGPGKYIYFSNPKGGIFGLGLLFGDAYTFNLMVSTIKFIN